jgi:xanthine/uracil permease
MSRLSASRALLYGTLAVGVLDLLDAFVFFWMRSSVPPIRILQSIAAGLLGRASFSGGARTAALGFVLHFLIAFVVVLVYLMASRILPFLKRHSIACGLAYGVVVYLVMNLVVVPLSAAVGGARPGAVILNGVLIHMFGVGLPAALAARAAG